MKRIFAIVFVAIMTICAIPCIAETTQMASASPVTVDLTGVIIAAVGLVFNFLIMWLAKKVLPSVKNWLEARTTAEQRTMMATLIRQLVLAAEQTIGAGQGKAKLQYVCDQLKQRGYNIDLDIIEANVKEMNNQLLTEVIREESTTETNISNNNI